MSERESRRKLARVQKTERQTDRQTERLRDGGGLTDQQLDVHASDCTRDTQMIKSVDKLLAGYGNNHIRFFPVGSV